MRKRIVASCLALAAFAVAFALAVSAAVVSTVHDPGLAGRLAPVFMLLVLTGFVFVASAAAFAAGFFWRSTRSGHPLCRPALNPQRSVIAGTWNTALPIAGLSAQSAMPIPPP